jgi:photosystem II stability/assembly factor-like uncharacterized protein
MNKRMLWSRILCGILCVAGIAMTALGLQLDGRSIYVQCLLSGIGLVALSAFLGDMRHRAFVYGALALGMVSVAVRIAYWAGQASHGYVQPGVFVELGPWATLTGASVVLLESFRASTPALGGVSMSVRRWRWSRVLCIVWLAMIAVGTVANLVNNSGLDLGWMEMPISVLGLVLPIVGIGLVPLGAFLGQSRYRKLLYGAFGLTVCGLITGLNVLRTDYFGSGPWWVFVGCVEEAFSIGVLMSSVGAVYVISESLQKAPVIHEPRFYDRLQKAYTVLLIVVLAMQFSWTPTTFTSKMLEEQAFKIECLAIDPKTPTTVYAGTWGGGVLRSTDAGDHWVAVSSGLPSGLVVCLAIDPRTPSTLYAGSNGIYHSTDRGDHWTAVSSGLPSGFVSCLAIDPRTPSTLYAGIRGSGVFRSTDNGNHWTAANAGLASQDDVWALAVDPAIPSILYAGGYEASVLRSTDAGDHWVVVDTEPPGHSPDCLAIDPQTPTTVYAGWDTGVWRSTDAGDNWQAASTGLPADDVYCLAINPQTPTTLYAGTWHDVYRSTDSGDHWQAVSTGIVTGSGVHCLVIDPQSPTTVYAGTRGGRAFRSTDSGDHWQAIPTDATD